MLAGWSSDNKFSLLGAIRAGSQMISYELVMGLTVLGLILIFGTLDLNEIVRQQSGVLFGFFPRGGSSISHSPRSCSWLPRSPRTSAFRLIFRKPSRS